MWNDLFGWLTENWEFALFVGVGAILLLCVIIVGIFRPASRAIWGVVAIISGGSYLFSYFDILDKKELLLAGAILLVWVGFSYLLTHLITAIVRGDKRKKAHKTRTVSYAESLPERGNEYVRARLNTVLREDACANGKTGADDGKATNGATGRLSPTELFYARDLLAKLQEKKLSATDVLQINELGKLFALYGKKGVRNSADYHTLNDGFACLLKLSAKYSVMP